MNIYQLEKEAIVIHNGEAKRYTTTTPFIAANVRAIDRVPLAEELMRLAGKESAPDAVPPAEKVVTAALFYKHRLRGKTFEYLEEKYPSVAELVQLTQEDVLRIRNFGRVRLCYLEGALKAEGLSLRQIITT